MSSELLESENDEFEFSEHESDNEIIQDMNIKPIESQTQTYPIYEIIGNDVTQKILSFIPYNEAVQYVDQTFKSLSRKNAEIRVNQRNKLVNNQNFDADFEKNVESIFNLNNGNNIDRDSPKQFLLTKREISSNFVDNKEVCHSFAHICDNDDIHRHIIVFVEDGDYVLSDHDEYWFKEIAIIGISDNVHIYLDFCCENEFRFYSDNIYIENVTIISPENRDYICVIGHANLWMKNVVVFVWFSIENADFHAKKCVFITRNETTFQIWSECNDFSVLGCTFIAAGDVKSFIEMYALYDFEEQNERNSFRVIANEFEGSCSEVMTANHPDWDRLHILGEGERNDWNEERVKIRVLNHQTIAMNIAYGSVDVNPNKIKPKKIKL